MSEQGARPVPAGWYADPEGSGRGRFWTGTTWSDVYHTPGEPLPPAPPLRAPEGTGWNTPWVWLIVLLPLLPLVLLLFIPWHTMFDIDLRAPDAASSGVMNTFAIFLSPIYWVAIVLGYVIYGLSVFFAYRDVRQLEAMGVPKPFHWAFAFIGGIVYTIGRSVVVVRRTGRGHAPLWAEIGMIVLSIAFAVYITVVMVQGMYDLFAQIPYRR